MKILAIILGGCVLLTMGLIAGRAQGVIAVQSIIANNCDKLQGFAVGSKVYSCERVKKEKKHD